VCVCVCVVVTVHNYDHKRVRDVPGMHTMLIHQYVQDQSLWQTRLLGADSGATRPSHPHLPYMPSMPYMHTDETRLIGATIYAKYASKRDQACLAYLPQMP